MPTTTAMITNMLPLLHSDSTSNLVWWTNAELVAWLDEAVKRLARMSTFFVVRDTSIATVSGTQQYTLPTRHLATIHVSYQAASTNHIPLRPTSTHELVALDQHFPNTALTGTPSRWFQDKIGETKIGLYPTPNAIKTLSVIHAEYHADISDGSNIDVPLPVADLLEADVLRAAYEKESDAACPEVASQLKELVRLYDDLIVEYFGAL